MILVNSPGSWSHIYSPFMHSHWHGLTPTDLVFSFFLFVVGSAMFFALKKTDFKLDIGQTLKIFKRGILIFLIGVLLNAYPTFPAPENMRILGALQRIALCYVIAAFLVMTLSRSSLLITCGMTLVSYMAVLVFFGGNMPFSLEQNLIRTVDLLIIGQNHMWNIQQIAFDPEGLLSTLPATINVIIGFLITQYISGIDCRKKVVSQLLQIGGLMLIIGFAWHQYMPINKSLWTSSYVLVSSGAASITLAFFIYLIDMKKLNRPIKPLLVYGTNPLFIYVLSWVWFESYVLFNIGDITLYQWLFDSINQVMPAKLASFIFALSHVFLFWLFSQWLYKNKIFIKL